MSGLVVVLTRTALYLVLRLKNRRWCEVCLKKVAVPVVQLGSCLWRSELRLRSEWFGCCYMQSQISVRSIKASAYCTSMFIFTVISISMQTYASHLHKVFSAVNTRIPFDDCS